MFKLFIRIITITLIITAIAVAVIYNQEITTFSSGFQIEKEGKRRMEVEDWEGARSIYETGLKQNPGNVDVALRLAEVYMHTNEKEKAEGIYKSILTQKPNDLKARLAYAQMLSQGYTQINEAVAQYKILIKEFGPRPDILSPLGDLYKYASENPYEDRKKVKRWLEDWAIYYYRLSLKRQPDQYQPRFNLGLLYQRQGMPRKASLQYCQVLMIDPQSYESRYNLGIALLEINAYEPGFRQMRRAVELVTKKDDINQAQVLAEKVQALRNSVFYDKGEAVKEEGLPPWLAKCLSEKEAEKDPKSETK